MANLNSIRNGNNVKTFNVLQLYDDYGKPNTKRLYHLDNMHWNSNGVQLVSKEIAKTITPEYANLPDVESTLTDGELAKHDNPPDAIFDELLITKQASLHNFKRRLS